MKFKRLLKFLVWLLFIQAASISLGAQPLIKVTIPGTEKFNIVRLSQYKPMDKKAPFGNGVITLAKKTAPIDSPVMTKFNRKFFESVHIEFFKKSAQDSTPKLDATITFAKVLITLVADVPHVTKKLGACTVISLPYESVAYHNLQRKTDLHIMSSVYHCTLYI